MIDEARAVLFDLFHTLTSLEGTGAPGRTTCEILGVPQEAWREQLFHFSHERLAGQMGDPVEIIRRLAHAIDPSIPMSVVEEATAERRRRFAHAVVHVPERNLRVLREMKARGKKLALVSNADPVEVAAWPDSPLDRILDTAVLSCDVGHVKPDPEIYQIALDRLGVRADEAVFVGDGGSDELRGARAVGMRTVLTLEVIREIWPTAIEERKAHADCIVESLDELIAAC